jgi:hypothetical protein
MGYGGNGDEYWGCQVNGRYGLFADPVIGYAGKRDTVVHDALTTSLWVQNQTLNNICTDSSISSKQY